MPERQWLAVSTTLSATRLPPQTKLRDPEEMATYDGYDETFAFCAYAKRLSAGSCALQTPERERQTNTSTAKTTTHDARHGLVVRKDWFFGTEYMVVGVNMSYDRRMIVVRT